MKIHIIALFLSFICLTVTAQKVTLAIHQDYLVPDIPLITQIGDTLKSSSPIGNHWVKDGVELQGENNPKLLIASSGNYKVTVTFNSGCSSESAIYNAIKTDIPIIQIADFNCRVFPNPNNGIFTVELEFDQSEVFAFELFTSDGKSVIKQFFDHPSGKQRILFGKSKLTNGVYYLQIKYGSNFLSRQIIVD